jgi:hypothetical protein
MNRLILHPFLVVLLPVFALYLNNLTTLTPASLVRPVLFLEVIALVSWLALRRCVRDTRAAAAVASVILFFFFLTPPSATWPVAAGWAFLGAALIRAGRQHPGRLASLSPVLNVMAITLLLLQSFQYIGATRKTAFETRHTAVLAAIRPDPEKLPHIVHIVLDGFARPDRIRQQFGCDLSFLVSHLETNGFFVADRACANYFQTMQCLVSSFAMDYLPGSTPETAGQVGLSRSQLSRIVADPEIKRELSRMGYRCEASIVTTNRVSTWINSDRGLLSLTETLLLQKSQLAPLLRLRTSTPGAAKKTDDAVLREHYARVKDMFLHEADCVRGKDPVYKVIHIISPHPPFIFRADGQYRDPGATSFIFSDGSHFLRSDEAWGNYREGYAEQVQFAARETARLVDRILRESARPVAILIQGDHGSGLGFNWDYSDGNLKSRTPILLAVRLPGRTHAIPAGFQSPVNLYRHLFRELWQADLPLLPTRVLYSRWHTPEIFEDVTARAGDDKP